MKWPRTPAPSAITAWATSPPREKALAIARDAGSPYVQPTIENVVSKAYPISRPLLMVTRGQPQGPVADFLDFVLGPEGQKIVAGNGFRAGEKN